MDINLEQEIYNNPAIAELCKDRECAVDFYSALCNMQWRKINYAPSEDMVIHKLKGTNPDIWSCSWRYAGGIIAAVRNKTVGVSEDYMDYYCSGREGTVAPIVKATFADMGWEPAPWPGDESI